MAAGVTNRLWEVSDIVALVEAEEEKAIPRRVVLAKARGLNFKRTHNRSVPSVDAALRLPV